MSEWACKRCGGTEQYLADGRCKACRKARGRALYATEAGRETKRAYQATPEVLSMRNLSAAKPERKEKRRAYATRPDRMEHARAHDPARQATPEVKERRAAYYRAYRREMRSLALMMKAQIAISTILNGDNGND